MFGLLQYYKKIRILKSKGWYKTLGGGYAKNLRTLTKKQIKETPLQYFPFIG